jgi:HD superfamily phosphodiesterase
MNTERYEKLKEQVFEVIKHKVIEDFGYIHCITHSDGVAVLCVLIGQKRGLNCDICRCAGLLHDLWLYNHGFPMTKEFHSQHGYKGSELARELLQKNGGYTSDEIEKICTAVYHHNDKDDIHDEYSEALKDADIMQHYLNGSGYGQKKNKHGRDKKVFDEFSFN